MLGECACAVNWMPPEAARRTPPIVLAEPTTGDAAANRGLEPGPRRGFSIRASGPLVKGPSGRPADCSRGTRRALILGQAARCARGQCLCPPPAYANRPDAVVKIALHEPGDRCGRVAHKCHHAPDGGPRLRRRRLLLPDRVPARPRATTCTATPTPRCSSCRRAR